jgi:hypothetical protein
MEFLDLMRTEYYFDLMRDPTRPFKRRLRSTALFLTLLLSIPMTGVKPGYAQDTLSEYQIKAAYLFNFLKFVVFPSESFADPLAPIVIGVVGEVPFGSALPQVVIGKTVQGRDLVIHRYRNGEDLRGAHILFISASERKRIPMILSSLRGSSVVTVADTAGFLDAGGMIQFLDENQRVRFAVNVDASSVAKLKISSKLLSLAKVVGGNVKEYGN